MPKLAVDVAALRRATVRLNETVVDPALWPEVMQDICTAVGAEGAILLQADQPTPDIPKTSGVEGLFEAYFRNDWYKHDLRAERAVPLLARGIKVVTDQDLVTPEEMRSSGYYQDCLLAHGFQWFAGIGFQADSAYWALSIQRTIRQGPFESAETSALLHLSDRLTEVATLSTAVGGAVLSNVVNALQLIPQAAIAMDRSGQVLEANSFAQKLFDAEFGVASRRLVIADAVAKEAFADFLERQRHSLGGAFVPVEPFVVQRPERAALVVRTLPIDGAARGPFLGARTLLLVTELGPKPAPSSELLIKAYSLSRAEARIAARVASGVSLEDVADELKIALATARTHIKAVFAKTGTHRQGELVALLAKF